MWGCDADMGRNVLRFRSGINGKIEFSAPKLRSKYAVATLVSTPQYRLSTWIIPCVGSTAIEESLQLACDESVTSRRGHWTRLDRTGLRRLVSDTVTMNKSDHQTSKSVILPWLGLLVSRDSLVQVLPPYQPNVILQHHWQIS